MFQRPDYFHFIPSFMDTNVSAYTNGGKMRTYNDRTRAAVVDVLERCTNFTAIFISSEVG